MSFSLEIPIQDLLDIVRKSLGELASPRDLKISEIGTGQAGTTAFRIDLISDTGDPQSEIRSFVQKYTNIAEIRLMQHLGWDFNLATLPELMHYSAQGDSGWFIVPFYEGRHLSPGAPLPTAIARTLAAIHAAYASRIAEFDWLARLDAGFIDTLVSAIFSAHDSHRGDYPQAEFAGISAALAKVGDAVPALTAALDDFPATVTHGEVQPGNIVQTVNDSYILVDWGGARIAPAMLDIAYMAAPDSDAWAAYAEAWAQATGAPLDMARARRAYTWATAIVDLQHLPAAISRLDAGHVHEISMNIVDAAAALSA